MPIPPDTEAEGEIMLIKCGDGGTVQTQCLITAAQATWQASKIFA